MKKSPHKDKEFAQCWSCLTKLSRIEVKNHLCPKPSQETYPKELDYKIKHKEDCMHKDCEKEVNCLCDCPRPAPSLEWEEIKKLLYEMDEMEFAASRDALFKDVDKLLADALARRREETLKEVEEMIRKELFFTSSPEGDWAQGYNKALKDLLQVLKDKP